MFNTRCVSIIPLMAARQGAKHISKCEERCLKRKLLCYRGWKSFFILKVQTLRKYFKMNCFLCDFQHSFLKKYENLPSVPSSISFCTQTRLTLVLCFKH